MKFAIALLAAAAALTPSFVTAGQGLLGVFEDPGAFDITIDDHSPGTRTVYIVHVHTDGSQGSAFAYEEGTGVTMVRLSAAPISPFLAIGDLDAGLLIAYTSCMAGTFPIYRIDYQTFGTSAECSELRVVPHPGEGGIVITDCAFNPTTRSYAAVATVNVNGTCDPNPVAPTTWGRVKALYR